MVTSIRITGLNAVINSSDPISGNSASIKIRVQPKASRNQVVGFTGDTLRLRVTAPPEAGKANQAVIALLSDTLGIAKFRIRIIRGRSSREKLVSIASLTREQVLLRLSPVLGQPPG